MADILIKGMEMPKQGFVRMMMWHDGGVAIEVNPKNYEQLEDKAVELPPHGRLVDGDKLLADHNPNENWDYMVLECIIRNAPTVVEATT